MAQHTKKGRDGVFASRVLTGTEASAREQYVRDLSVTIKNRKYLDGRWFHPGQLPNADDDKGWMVIRATEERRKFQFWFQSEHHPETGTLVKVNFDACSGASQKKAISRIVNARVQLQFSSRKNEAMNGTMVAMGERTQNGVRGIFKTVDGFVGDHLRARGQARKPNTPTTVKEHQNAQAFQELRYDTTELGKVMAEVFGDEDAFADLLKIPGASEVVMQDGKEVTIPTDFALSIALTNAPHLDIKDFGYSFAIWRLVSFSSQPPHTPTAYAPQSFVNDRAD
jgi:hypothetical protein